MAFFNAIRPFCKGMNEIVGLNGRQLIRHGLLASEGGHDFASGTLRAEIATDVGLFAEQDHLFEAFEHELVGL